MNFLQRLATNLERHSWRSVNHNWLAIYTNLYYCGHFEAIVFAAKNWLAQKSGVKPLSQVTDPFRLTAPVEVWNVPGSRNCCDPKIAGKDKK